MEGKNWLDACNGKILEMAQRVLACDSPSGYTGNVLKLTAFIAEEMGYPTLLMGWWHGRQAAMRRAPSSAREYMLPSVWNAPMWTDC